MRRALLGVGLLACVPSWGREVGNVVFADAVALEQDGPQLRLAGAGTFRFLFIRYYACALYVAAGLNDAQAMLAADSPRRVAITALRRITAFEFLWGLDHALADNLDDTEKKMLAADLDRLRATMRAIGRIEAGTPVAIDYLPGRGVRILAGGTQHGAMLPGKPLADALLKVWIGERPLDAALKEALLGR